MWSTHYNVKRFEVSECEGRNISCRNSKVVQITDNMTFQLLDLFMYCTMLHAYCMWADLLGNGVAELRWYVYMSIIGANLSEYHASMFNGCLILLCAVHRHPNYTSII